MIWPGELSDLPCPLLGEEEGVPVGDDGVFVGGGEGEFAGDDEGAALAAVVLAGLRPPLDPAALLIPSAVLLNTPVVVVVSAFIPTTMLPTSRSKRTAYSGPATPASSSAMRRNILAPEAAYHANRPRISPAEKAIFGHIVSRLIKRSVELLTVTTRSARSSVGFDNIFAPFEKPARKKPATRAADSASI
jgi:hypothetical protein